MGVCKASDQELRKTNYISLFLWSEPIGINDYCGGVVVVVVVVDDDISGYS